MFDLHGNDRLTAWRQFRDSLEISNSPFEDVAEFWSHAPFVGPYLNPNNSSEWPDPWHLVLDLRLDDLAISLGMLYTLQLTRRFMNSDYEIHTSMPPEDKLPKYFLLVDKKYALNLEYRNVVDMGETALNTNIIWCSKRNK